MYVRKCSAGSAARSSLTSKRSGRASSANWAKAPSTLPASFENSIDPASMDGPSSSRTSIPINPASSQPKAPPEAVPISATRPACDRNHSSFELPIVVLFLNLRRHLIVLYLSKGFDQHCGRVFHQELSFFDRC